jgi:hypothetical protein
LVIHKKDSYHTFTHRDHAAKFITELLENRINEDAVQMRITRAVADGTPEIDVDVAVYKL